MQMIFYRTPMASISSTTSSITCAAEFLGEVRCRVFDVSPPGQVRQGPVLGDVGRRSHQDYNRGTGRPHPAGIFTSTAAHQCERGCDAFLYIQQEKIYTTPGQELDFKRRRAVGYNVGRSSQEQELAGSWLRRPVQDDTRHQTILSPFSKRSWGRQRR